MNWVRVCIALVAAACAAQESVHFASVGGRVLDASGAAICNAEVSLRDTETNRRAAATTGEDGRFRIPYLRPGPYELSAHHPGFGDFRRKLSISAGSAFEFPISLAVAASETNVTVVADGPALEGARSQVAATLSRDEVQSLPLGARNFLDAALVVPGVSPTNTGSNQLFAETAGVPGQGLSIGSQRNFSNNFIVDGLSNNDDAAGLAGASYGLDVVEEVHVVTSGAQAEFGRALAGYVNVVTKSGTNTPHGDAYGFLGNRRWNAANPLSHTTLPMTLAQYGASVGGPLVRDRTFYFGNFEQRNLNQSGLTTISTPNVAIINARLNAVGYPGSPVTTGLFPNPVHSSNVFARLDHQLSARDELTARYSVYRATSVNSRGAGGLNAPTASSNLVNTDHVIAVGNVLALSPRMVNETRGQFWSSDLEAPPSDPIGPAVSISGVATFGTLSGSPAARRNKLVEIVDNLSYQRGAHAVRAGVEFLYNTNTIVFPRAYRGSYAFSSLSNFLSGAYNNLGFTQTFGATEVGQSNPNVALYAQDEWKVSNRLTLNAGLRHELQFLKTVATDTNNIAPRAGFAWTPSTSRRTIVRGGFGLFYDRVPLRALANALLSANNTANPANLAQIAVSFAPSQSGAPVFPNILSALTLPPGVLFNFTTMDPHMQNAYSTQGSVEVEQEIGARTTLAVGYEHLRGLHLIAAINQNPPLCAATGGNNGCRANAAIANNSQYSPRADSWYDALHVSLVRRPTAWASYRVSYTYSKAFDDVGEFFFSSPIDNLDIWKDYGRSDDDQHHRVAADGTLRMPRGINLGAMFQYYSALPLNIVTGAQTVQGTPARPGVDGKFIPRNAGQGSDFLNISARVAKTFRITERVRVEALAEAFNLTNRVNAVSRNQTWGAGAYPSTPLPSFGAITAVGDPRRFQFGLRLHL